MSVGIGDIGAKVISVGREVDPVNGSSTILILEGSQQALEQNAASQKRFGASTSIFQHEGPTYRSRQSWPTLVFPTETPEGLDTYEFSTNTQEVDIFADPAATDATTGEPDLQIFQAYRRAIENNEALPSGAPSALQIIAQEYALGERAFIRNGVSLRRRRTIPAGTFGVSLVNRLIGKGQVYSEARLIADFALPNLVTKQLPTTAGFDTIPNATWGWLMSKQESTIIPAIQKQEEIIEWELAAWSTLHYTHLA